MRRTSSRAAADKAEQPLHRSYVELGEGDWGRSRARQGVRPNEMVEPLAASPLCKKEGSRPASPQEGRG